MKRLSGILVFLPVFAWAQNTTDPADPTPRKTVQASNVFGSPCPYPNAPLRAGTQGITQFSYRVTSDRTVNDIAIVRSSGNAELDKAAVSCVRNWNVEAATWVAPGIHEDSIRWLVPPAIAAQSNLAQGELMGKPHDCQAWYPRSALKAGIGGIARVRFLITTTGTVRDPEIITSTGDSELDQATKRCVKYWHYRPAVQNGTPVETSWTADVRWTPPQGLHDCQSWYPHDEIHANVDRTVGVHFTITATGSVRDPSVVVSSGHPDFDRAALACVTTWRYEPPMQNGVPAEKPWNTDIRWAPSPPPQENGQ